MTRKPEKRGLGRGLSALIGDLDAPEPEAAGGRTRDLLVVDITRLVPNPDQPRRRFDEAELEDLARSIAEKGILQPLVVRPNPDEEGSYQIVAGERRWRAAQRARVDRIPVIVRDLTDLEVLEIAIIENVQRADLNPIEEARGYQMLMETFGHTQEKLSEALGKSRSYLANAMRLLKLPKEVLELVEAGELTAGHARAMITAEDPAALAREAVAKGLSVRQVEAMARKPKAERKAPKPPHEKDADTVSLEADLSANLGMKVSIDHREESGSGTLQIHYRSLEDLDRLCALLSSGHSAGSI